MTDAPQLLPMAPRHLAGALALSQALAWPYRLQDWAAALQLGQGLVWEQAGTVIGTAACWCHGAHQASAGMVIVAGQAQGRGLGARLMDALLAPLGGRTITLNATAEGLLLYQRRGFVAVGTVTQHQGLATAGADAPAGGDVRPLQAADFAALARLDLQATGWPRAPMLRALCELGDAQVLWRDGQPRGYSISRLFGRGHVIGPVVADSAEAARTLIHAALARLGPVFVRIDTAPGTPLGAWLQRQGLAEVGQATTMVRGQPAQASGPARLFALANQSFN